MAKRKTFSVYEVDQVIVSYVDDSEYQTFATGNLSEAKKRFNNLVSEIKQNGLDGSVKLSKITVEDHGKKWFVLRLVDQTEWLLEREILLVKKFSGGDLDSEQNNLFTE
jgi:hypothetical protein